MAELKNEKQWTFDINNAVTAVDLHERIQEVVFALYGELIAWGALPLACCWWDGSSYVVSRAGDGTANAGRFLSADQIQWRTASSNGPKSWAVLRLPHSIGELTMQMRRYNNTMLQFQMFISRGGWDTSMGNESTLPALNAGATEQLLPQSTGNVGYRGILHQGLPPNGVQWHRAKSTDGHHFRFWSSSNTGGATCNLFAIEKLADTPLEGGDAYAIIYTSAWFDTPSPTLDHDRFFNRSTEVVFGSVTGPSADVQYRTAGVGAARAKASLAVQGTTGSAQNRDGNVRPLLPITLWCDHANATGYMGRLVDMWWSPETWANGKTLVQGGVRTHVQLGTCLLTPWDGSSVCETGTDPAPGDIADPVKVYGTAASTSSTSIVRQNPLLVRGEP